MFLAASVNSLLVWSYCFSKRDLGRKPCSFSGRGQSQKPYSWRFAPLFLGRMVSYLCLDLSMRKIRVLFDIVVLVVLFGWIIILGSFLGFGLIIVLAVCL